MKLNPILAMTLLALLPAVPAFAAASQPVIEQPEISNEVSVAPEKFGKSRFTQLDNLKHRHLDGVRGGTINSYSERPVVEKINGDVSLGDLWGAACRSAEFGLFQLEAKKSFAGDGGAGIYTKLRFKRLEDWRGNVRPQADTLQLVIPGGEIVYRGEKLRIDNPNGQYEVGASYVIKAGERSQLGRDRIIYDNPPFQEVQDGIIYAAPGWAPFASGTSLKAARTSVAKVLDLKSCE